MTFRTVLHFLYYMTAFYIHCSVKPLIIIIIILVYVMSIYTENLTTIVQLITN